MGENSGNLRSPHVVISEGRPGTGLPTATGLVDHVMPNFGRPLVRCDVWGLCRLYDGHEAGLFSSSSAAGEGSVAHNLRRGLGVTTRGS